MQPNNRIAVIIPYYNALRYLKRCVGSLLIHSPSHLKICIIDNASEQHVSTVIEDDNIIKIRNKQNLGFTKAVNQGIERFPQSDIVLMNSDCEVTKNWLNPLIGCVYSGPRVALACPRHITARGDTSINRLTSPSPKKNKNGYRLMIWAGFTAVYIRRDALNDVGLLNEKLWHYSSDENWCRMATAKGWKILWQPDSKVKHIGAASYVELIRRDPKTAKKKVNPKI